MLIQLRAIELPGQTWASHTGIHVALQVRKEPHKPVSGDADSATWETEVDVLHGDGGLDFRGPAVHGKPHERFLYLTWGELEESTFTMFRRAKLMLADLGLGVLDATTAVGSLSLTDAKGGPLCGTVKPGVITWTLS